jgi:hypothetical protein
MPDPTGGTFDASGDFDRFMDDAYSGYEARLTIPMKRSVDPYDNTEMPSSVMASLLEDIAIVIPVAREGYELRGLLRLRVMAEQCAAQ